MTIYLENGNVIEEATRDRSTYIGGSDIAAILGISKYKTALDVYNAKVNGKSKDDCLLFRLGRHMEPLILDIYVEKMGDNFFEHMIFDFNVYSKEFPFFGAQLDFLGYNCKDGIVIADAKNVKSFRYKEFGGEGTCDIPFDIICQVAWQRYLTGAHHVDIPVFFAEQTELKIFSYYEDKDMESSIASAAMSFWQNHVLARVEPEPQNEEDLRQIYPVSRSNEIRVGASIYQKIQSMKSLKAEVKELEEAINGIEFEIKKCFEDGDVMKHGDDIIATFKSHEANRLDSKLLEKERPEIYQAYLKKSTQRPLRLK